MRSDALAVIRVARPAGPCWSLLMNKLQPYTLGQATDGTRYAHLGDAVDAKDFISEGVVFYAKVL